MRKLDLTIAQKKELTPIHAEIREQDHGVERAILEFVREKGFKNYDFLQLYKEFCKLLPTTVKKPTPNAWIYQYSMLVGTNILDRQYKGYNNYLDKVTELEAQEKSEERDKELADAQKRVVSFEKRILEFLRTVIKYSNDGVNREQPKQVEHTHKTKVSLNDIHQIMDENTIKVN